MYTMHWTLKDVRDLTLEQLNWIVDEIKRIKKEEARRLKVKV